MKIQISQLKRETNNNVLMKILTIGLLQIYRMMNETSFFGNCFLNTLQPMGIG